MNRFTQYIYCLFFFLSTITFCQAQVDSLDVQAVHDVLDDLFDGMRESDSLKVKSVFADGAKMNSVYTKKNGEFVVRDEKPAGFITAVGTPHEGVWDEKLLSVEIRIDGNLAQVWTPYEFYLDEDFQHCGVNAFHMIRTTEGWKILQLTDTRRRSSCDQLKEK